MEQFPLEEIKKEAEQLLYITRMRKTHTKLVGGVETQFHNNPSPWHCNKQLGGNFQLLSEESSVWTHPTSSTPTFKTSTQGMDPQNTEL